MAQPFGARDAVSWFRAVRSGCVCDASGRGWCGVDGGCDMCSIALKSRCDQLGRDLNQYVPVTNLGELRLYAGCRFSCDFNSGTITILQQTVAENMVEKSGVTRTKETPMVVGLRLDDFDPTEPDVDEPFRSLVGYLMWLANQTRPDILNAVRAGARYSHAPKLVNWKAALHVITYARFTSSYGITFQRGTASGVDLEVFVDSDFASRATDRRSVSGGVVMCAGACVSFFSRPQKSVTLSSTEAEYVAMAEWFKEVIFLRYIWSFIFPDRDVGCTTIFEGNVGALHLANNPTTTPNSKRIHGHSPPLSSGACSERGVSSRSCVVGLAAC